MRRKRDAAATRGAITAAALDLFAQYGFEGATIERIARQARVNKAMISYHFRGKRRLYTAILDETFGMLARRIEALSTRERMPEERFRAFLTAFREVAEERPSFPQLMLREVLTGGRYVDHRVMRHLLRAFRLTQDIIAQGTEIGSFRPTNPAHAHLGLLGSVIFYFATAKFRQRIQAELGVPVGPEETAEYLQEWQQVILRGLAAEPPPTHPGGSTT